MPYFILDITQVKSRSLQTQYFPLLVEPVIQIISLMPEDNVYYLNLDVQRTALKILKEITRQNTFDDTSQLQVLIERLKRQFFIL